MRKPYDNKKTTNSLSVIQLKGASNERVEGPPGANVSDGPGGVTALGSKSMASVVNIPGSRGSGWGNSWDCDVCWEDTWRLKTEVPVI